MTARDVTFVSHHPEAFAGMCAPQADCLRGGGIHLQHQPGCVALRQDTVAMTRGQLPKNSDPYLDSLLCITVHNAPCAMCNKSTRPVPLECSPREDRRSQSSKFLVSALITSFIILPLSSSLLSYSPCRSQTPLGSHLLPRTSPLPRLYS